MFETDVVILGGGPAGSAAAISCAAAGLRALLVERRPFPRSSAGETLHPGVLPLLQQLGVENDVLAAGFLRHEGHFVRWGGTETFVPFGGHDGQRWLGVQAWRPTFDRILLERARKVGVRIAQPARPQRVLMANGAVIGVAMDCGAICGRYVIDATGRHAWLARQLGLRFEPRGPNRVAWYGYAEGDRSLENRAPSLTADDNGWTWVACVQPGLYQWTRLNFDGRRPTADWRPDELRGLISCVRARGADVSWRIASKPAGPGYYLVGDAATVLDPASSHGVLRSLMTGIMAGHLIANVASQNIDSASAADLYTNWLHTWFEHDVQQLDKLYSALADSARTHKDGWA